MKPKLLSKLKRLGEQVEPLRQFVENAPSQAARIREAVVLTAGQLQQLRSEIQTGITDLRADSGDHLLRSLAEIGDSTGILRQAGFELTGVDLELGLTVGQRFLLQLRRVEEVPAAMVRALATANPDRPALRGVLAALQRAIELEDTVDLPNLEFRQLTVAVGPVPSIRIGWRPEMGQETAAAASAPVPEPVPAATAQAFAAAPPLLAPRSSTIPPPDHDPAPAPAPATGSRIPSTGAPATVPTPESRPRPPLPQAVPSPTPTPSIAAKPLAANWRSNALDRFKKMPDLTKGH